MRFSVKLKDTFKDDLFPWNHFTEYGETEYYK